MKSVVAGVVLSPRIAPLNFHSMFKGKMFDILKVFGAGVGVENDCCLLRGTFCNLQCAHLDLL